MCFFFSDAVVLLLRLEIGNGGRAALTLQCQHTHILLNPNQFALNVLNNLGLKTKTLKLSKTKAASHVEPKGRVKKLRKLCTGKKKQEKQEREKNRNMWACSMKMDFRNQAS